jgi:hypothetical protein
MPAVLTAVASSPESRPGLIPRLGVHDDGLLPVLVELELGAVARTAAQHVAHPEFAAAARARGLEVLVDPDCWRNQFSPKQRPVKFADTGYAIRRKFDPDRHQLSREQERGYVRTVFEFQQRAGVRRLISPYHRAGGPTSASRSLDLRLATIAAEQLPQITAAGRSLLIGIALAPSILLEPTARAWLTARYTSFHDRFFIKIDGLCDTSTQDDIRAACEFLAALREGGTKEIVLAGAKNLAWSLTGAGLIDSVVLGLNEGEIWRFEPKADDVRARVIFHRTGFRSVAPESPRETGRTRAHRLFELFPCGCEQHETGIPPRMCARKEHTLRLRAADYALLNGDVLGNERLLKGRLREADRIARKLGYPKVRRSFLIAYVAATAMRRRLARRQLEN